MFETGEELPAERFAQASAGAPFECRIPIGDFPDGGYIVSVRAEVDSAVVERQASLLLVTPEKGGR